MLLRHVSALYVDPKGSYPKAVVDWWDEKRDATRYAGPNPVVAHPPCQRWCRLAGLVEKRWGYKRGDDGGTFAAALASLRAWGGVLEHPAYSDAWAAHDLPSPPTGCGWIPGARDGEWTCYVEQWRYGHKAKKATWLYYVGKRPPFVLRFGHLADAKCATSITHQIGGFYHGPPTALVSWCGNHVASGESRPRLSKAEAIRTPPEFLQTLLFLAAFSRWGV